MADIPTRTRALDLLGRLIGRSVADTAIDELARLRVAVPRNRLVDAVTGGVDPRVKITDVQVPTRAGMARVRVYDPAAQTTPPDAGSSPGSAECVGESGRREGGTAVGDAPPLVVLIHGGGWVLGTLEAYDPLAAHIAHAVGAVVASVEYRLAPEHPAPAAIYDCLDVVRALIGRVADGPSTRRDSSSEAGADSTGAPALLGTRVDACRYALVGDSAGGNLVAVLTQLLRDAGDPAAAAQVLLYPSVDSTCLRRSKIEFARGPILSRRDTDAFFAHYLGTGPGALSPENPLISPLLGDLGALPPALIQTAGLDPLRDEGIAYAQGLARAGVPTEHTDYSQAPHGFASWPGASVGAWQHRPELTDFLRRHLYPAP
ncbi:MAG: alpha/beta hydrolase [Micrococcales bacterium]|nr:alpha/beta hydrolase [Micrococcales bacterium]